MREQLVQSALDSLVSGYPILIFTLIPLAVVYLLGLFIYVKLTPYRELELVQQGNMAAAVTFSALVVSLALPLAACLVNRYSIFETTLWGVVSLILQLLLFRVTDAIFKGIPERIEGNEVPAATVFASFKIAGSILLAFAIGG